MIAAFLLAAAVDAGTPDAGSWTDDPIYAECPAAPAPVQLDDGSFKLPPLRAARNACLMSSCEEDRERLKTVVPPLSWFTWAVGVLALALGVAGGFYFGFEVRGLFGR